jgi:archaemetzincin
MTRGSAEDRLFWVVIGVVSAVTLCAVVLVARSGDPPPAAAERPAASSRSSPALAGPAPDNNTPDTTAPEEERPRHRIVRDSVDGSWRWVKVRGKQPERPRTMFSLPATLKREQVFEQVQGAGAFTRLGEPEPGDWLWSFKEPGQTLEEYAREVRNRKVPGRETLHIQPYTDLRFLQGQVVPRVRQHTAIFFDTPVEVLPPVKPAAAWLHRRRRQYDAGQVVSHLARRVPADSLGLFGLMGSDLHGLNLNFLFGMALLHRRAGVFSLHRYGTAQPALTRRALKLSAHELGHMFGLKHCVFYKCLMNGTNSLEEMDGQPLHLCPVCLAKLHWNLRFDPARRYRRLAAFYRRVGLKPEARFAAARAKELGGR